MGGAGGPITAPNTGQNQMTPPNTGDGGLMDAGTSWTLSAAFLVVAVAFGATAGLGTVRSRR
jgi:hypothetical protein